MAFSEDEGMNLDPSLFTGLFKPDLLKSLLRKAKAITNLESDPVLDSTPNPGDSGHLLFLEPIVEAEVIPSPKLFLDIVQRQWSNPGAGLPLSRSERKLYNVAADLSEALQIHTVDKPVAALTSVALLPANAIDYLKADDKKAELTLCKAHQVAAWAVKATMSASFFNRASLLWLCQMQERIPPRRY